MEPLQIMYIAMFVVGAFFLILSIFGGDAEADLDLDVGDPNFDISDAEAGVDSPNIFSIRTLATLLLGFGAAGWIVIRNGGGIPGQIIWGFVVGLIVSALYFLVMKGMYSMQGSSMSTAASLLGKIATVSIPTTPSGRGQIRIPTASGSTDYSCVEKNGAKLKQNEQVKVISVIDAGTLMVEKS